MLRPAILYKEELEKKFAEELYTDRYFMFSGYPYDNVPHEIKAKHDSFSLASVEDGRVVGYIGYNINPMLNEASNFGLYAFEPWNATFMRDIKDEMRKILRRYRRIEWRMVGGNPIEKAYDSFCERHGGHKHTLHDATRDIDGNYRDTVIYEIVR